MAIKTRLTEFFGLEHPIVLAPMDPASGGELASAVSAAGALGLLGGLGGDTILCLQNRVVYVSQLDRPARHNPQRTLAPRSAEAACGIIQ